MQQVHLFLHLQKTGQGRRKSKKTAQKSVKESSQDVTTIETEDEAARDALNTLEQATVSKLAGNAEEH